MRFRLNCLRGVLGCLLVGGLLACTPQVPPQRQGQPDGADTDQGVGHGSSVPHLRTHVIRVLPHDRSSFTQGLELADGVLYEGTGTYGGSTLQAIDPGTGKVHRETRLPAALFGEGITIVDDRIWQLTWQEGIAILRDRATFAEIERVRYSGEGWGLCYDGKRLISSDGSERLTFRDPGTFAETGEVKVTLDGSTVDELNELECVGGQVWANVWNSEEILRIDPNSGRVTAVVDASGLLEPDQEARADVLNGIASVPGTDEFLLTGKYWPHVFRVRFG